MGQNQATVRSMTSHAISIRPAPRRRRPPRTVALSSTATRLAEESHPHLVRRRSLQLPPAEFGRAPRHRYHSRPAGGGRRQARWSPCCSSCASGDRRWLRWRLRRWQRLDDLHRNELQHGRRGDLAEFLAPPEKLAHMNASRSRDLGNTGPRLKRRRDQPLLLLPRPAPAPLDRRDHFNLMLRHRATPSACTRTCSLQPTSARRP